MSIWSTVSGFFGGGTTPPFNPNSPAPTSYGGASNPLEEIKPVARGYAEATGHGDKLEPIEPQLEPVEVNYGEHSLIAPTLTKAALESKSAPWSFDMNALKGLPMGGGGGLPPGGRVQAGVGDMAILDFYNRNAAMQNAAQGILMNQAVPILRR